MKLRYYQVEAVNAIIQYFCEKEGNPLVVMPTGTGKSVVIAEFLRVAYSWYPGQRYIVLTHVKELIAQNFDKLLRVWPTAPAGIFSSGLKRKDVWCPITFAGIDSIAKCPEAFGKIDIVVIDEAHRVSDRETAVYFKFLLYLKTVNPLLKVVGLTATDYRAGMGRLTEGKLFTDVCYNIGSRDSFNRLIDEGYLCMLIPKRTEAEISTEGVHIRMGEFVEKEAQEAADKITEAAVKELIRKGGERYHWLIFASGVEHVMHVVSALEYFGVPTTYVHSKMSDNDRDRNIEDFRNGKYLAMVNNGVLTTGFDDIYIDLIAVMRLTNSPGLFVQMLGRGGRPVYADGYDLETVEGRLDAIRNSCKPNCLVLDFAGNVKRLGPINDPIIPKPRGKGPPGDAPIRICEECDCYNHASARVCFNCGFEFPRALTKIGTKASIDPLIASSEPVKKEIFKVDKVLYKPFHRQGRTTCLNVQYYSGLRMFNKYVVLESDHPGRDYPRKLGRDWWREMAQAEPPETCGEAMKRLSSLREPTHILVELDEKNPQVIRAYYEGDVVE